MERDLGTLYRRLAYSDLYDAVADQRVFSRLLTAGWFPFVEILGAEFQTLANSCEAGFALDNEEAQLIAKFDFERLERSSSAGWLGHISLAKSRSYDLLSNLSRTATPCQF
jgi:hypothetical protein